MLAGIVRYLALTDLLLAALLTVLELALLRKIHIVVIAALYFLYQSMAAAGLVPPLQFLL